MSGDVNRTWRGRLEIKKQLQHARNRLHRMAGVEVLGIYEKGAAELLPVEQAFGRYMKLWNAGGVPSARLSAGADWEEIVNWVPGQCGLQNGQEVLLLLDFGIWAGVRILNTAEALASFMEEARSFTVFEADTGRFIDFGLDSGDEYHYQMYVWQAEQGWRNT